jgi:hypothetical protein
MDNHHPIIQKALDFAEGADDAEGLAEIKKQFYMIDRTSRRVLLDNLGKAFEDECSLRQRAELLALSRELKDAHAALNKVGR